MGQKARCMQTLVLALVLAVFGCSKNRTLDPELEGYVSEFEQASQRVGKRISAKDISVKFVSTTSRADAVAQCLNGGMGPAEIEISQSLWEQLSETRRKLTIFHELGHCKLNRSHRSDHRSDGTPASIMFIYNVPEQVFLEDENYYLDELFNSSASK